MCVSGALMLDFDLDLDLNLNLNLFSCHPPGPFISATGTTPQPLPLDSLSTAHEEPQPGVERNIPWMKTLRLMSVATVVCSWLIEPSRVASSRGGLWVAKQGIRDLVSSTSRSLWVEAVDWLPDISGGARWMEWTDSGGILLHFPVFFFLWVSG